MSARSRSKLFFSIVVIALLGCSSTTQPNIPDEDPVDAEPLQLVAEFDPLSIWNPSVQENVTVKVGIFLYTDQMSGDETWTRDDASESIRDLVSRSATVFSYCHVGIELEEAQVLYLPPRLRQVQGNSGGSYGGHPPHGVDNLALFNYEQNERLTDETRELFSYGKEHTSPNTISVFVVDGIRYFTGGEALDVMGLSYAPNIYHHQDDYPMRNSTLVAEHLSPNGLPLIGGNATYAMVRNLGFMLLNTGLTVNTSGNLLGAYGRSTTLTSAQCDRMHEVIDFLYGKEEVYDPGPPS